MSKFAAGVMLAIAIVATARADVLSDPMRPYTRQLQIDRGPAGRAFVLSAILYSANRRVAIVNGQPLSEGQSVNGARLRRIDRGKVELVVNGEILKLTLVSDRHAK